jgi:hypothetical protein
LSSGTLAPTATEIRQDLPIGWSRIYYPELKMSNI